MYWTHKGLLASFLDLLDFLIREAFDLDEVLGHGTRDLLK